MISSKFSINSITSLIVPQANGTAFLKHLLPKLYGMACSFRALYCFYGDQSKHLALCAYIGIMS